MRYKLREASIDHMTPGTYRDAMELERSERWNRPRFGHRRNPAKMKIHQDLVRSLESNPQMKRTVPKGLIPLTALRNDVAPDLKKNKGNLIFMQRTRGGKGGKNKKTVHLVSTPGSNKRTEVAGQAAHMVAPAPGGATLMGKPLKSRLAKRDWNKQVEVSFDPQRSLGTALSKKKEMARRKDAVNVLSHELLHVHDPANVANSKGRKPGPLHSRQYKDYHDDADGYFASPVETHAYSGVSGRLGMRSLKKHGLPHSDAREILRSGASHERIQNALHPHGFHGLAAYSDFLKSSNKGYKRAGRKHFKELYKGMERTYGSRGRTIGRNKLGVPVGKLPESLDESSRKIGDYSHLILKNSPEAKALYRHVKKNPHKYRGRMGSVAVASERDGKLVVYRPDGWQSKDAKEKEDKPMWVIPKFPGRALKEDLLAEADKWMEKAVKRPGAFKAKAQKAGMSTSAFAARVLTDTSKYDDRTVKQANLAKTFAKFRKKNVDESVSLASREELKKRVGRYELKMARAKERGDTSMYRVLKNIDDSRKGRSKVLRAYREKHVNQAIRPMTKYQYKINSQIARANRAVDDAEAFGSAVSRQTGIAYPQWDDEYIYGQDANGNMRVFKVKWA